MTNPTSLRLLHLLFFLGATMTPVMGLECEQGMMEWLNLGAWSEKASWDITDFPPQISPDKKCRQETTKDYCIGTFIFLKMNPSPYDYTPRYKVFLMRGCDDEGVTIGSFLKYVTENDGMGGGGSPQAARSDWRSLGPNPWPFPKDLCGMLSLAADGSGLMLGCSFAQDKLPPREGNELLANGAYQECHQAFLKHAKVYQKKPATFPTEKVWHCNEEPPLTAICPQGGAEFPNIREWHAHKGSWRIDEKIDDKHMCNPMDDSGVPKYKRNLKCIGLFVVPPKSLTGDKVFMFRGCEDKAFKDFMNRKVMENQGGPSGRHHNGDTGFGMGGATTPARACAILANKKEGFIMLFCLFHPEYVPSAYDTVHSKCLNGFHRDAKRFRKHPEWFPETHWNCGDRVGRKPKKMKPDSGARAILSKTIITFVVLFWSLLWTFNSMHTL